jgi:hypothetical protein
MHRRILLSSTYREASGDRPEARDRDPENRLLARMNRRRLDWESLRDALLATSGRIDPAIGGRAVPLTTLPYNPRRTVYGYIDRRDLPGVFRVFNLASPDQHTPRRHETTVPQQALYLLNHPFVIEQARSLAARTETAHAATAEDRLRVLYRLVLQREASPDELVVGAQYLTAAQPVFPDPGPPSPWQYGTANFDAAEGRLSAFEPLDVWTGASWRPGPPWQPSMPEHATLTREGGQPGREPGRAAVRRWVAPVAGTVAIAGKVRHDPKEGDGVLAAIHSSRAGQLGRWEVHAGEADAAVERVEVEAGEAIDFVVIGRENSEADAFAWSPEVRYLDPAPVMPAEWKADRDFAGPPPRPLTPLEELAQALLLSNEFTFVD